MKKVILLLFLLMVVGFAFSQESAIKVAAYDGVVVGGYVDEGAYLNFTGPNLGITLAQTKFIFGMLPSLRFKSDHSTPKNSFVTPSLGVGITFIYQRFALQLPFYYTAKTSKSDGSWMFGAGIGIKLNQPK